jgi:hypothetical protein
MRMAQIASNQSAVSHYGRDSGLKDGVHRNVPLSLFKNKPESSNLISYPRRKMPTSYVLTKIHCGGECMVCGPDGYIETLQSFKCLFSHSHSYDEVVPLKKDSPLKEYFEFTYSEDMVKRAVHIIRDPFDNIVSRFHWHNRHSKDEKWTQNYPSNSTGFRNWCQHIDSANRPQEETSRFFSKEMRTLFKQIPCHGDFYKYIQWHNLAAETRNNMDLPTLVVHYENYAKNLKQTLNELMGFLQLEVVGDVPELFVPGRIYREYFSKEERIAVLRMMKLIATNEAWNMMSTYNYV